MESWARAILIAWLGFVLVFGPHLETPPTKTPKPKADFPTTHKSFVSTTSEQCSEIEVAWVEDDIYFDSALFQVASSAVENDTTQTKPLSPNPIPLDDDDLFTPFTLEENLETDETKFERISNFDPYFTTGLVELLKFASNHQLPAKDTPSLSLNGSILTSLQRLRI